MKTARVKLTKGYYATIDRTDLAKVSAHKWHAAVRVNTVYAATNVQDRGGKKTILLHRFLMNAKRGELVDHRDRNGLNCRKRNLRLATTAQNMTNTKAHANNKSGYRGVSWHSQHGKWRAVIMGHGRYIHLGLFNCKKKAARAYDKAARRYHGPYATVNFET